MVDIAEKMKKHMASCSLNASSLSRKSGIPRTTIQNILNGTSHKPRIEILTALASTMNCRIKDLLSDNDSRLTQYAIKDEFSSSFLSDNIKINRMDEMLKAELERVDSILEHFDYTSHFIEHIGQQIAKNGSDNLDFITNLLSEGAFKKEKLFAWTFFDWVNDKNLMVASNYNILMKPVDMTNKRKYMTKVRKEPWKMFFDPPALSIPGNEWIIPAAMGISDENGYYIGTITLGFNIKVLYEKIINATINENIRFIILDEEHNIMIQPVEFYQRARKDFFKNSLKKISLQQKGQFFNKIDYNDIILSNYKKSSKNHFIVLAGYFW